LVELEGYHRSRRTFSRGGAEARSRGDKTCASPLRASAPPRESGRSQVNGCQSVTTTTKRRPDPRRPRNGQVRRAPCPSGTRTVPSGVHTVPQWGTHRPPVGYAPSPSGVRTVPQWGTHRLPVGYAPCPSGVRTVSQWGTHRVPVGYVVNVSPSGQPPRRNETPRVSQRDTSRFATRPSLVATVPSARRYVLAVLHLWSLRGSGSGQVEIVPKGMRGAGEQASRLLPTGVFARRWFPKVNRIRTYAHDSSAHLLHKVVSISFSPPAEDARPEQARRLARRPLSMATALIARHR